MIDLLLALVLFAGIVAPLAILTSVLIERWKSQECNEDGTERQAIEQSPAIEITQRQHDLLQSDRESIERYRELANATSPSLGMMPPYGYNHHGLAGSYAKPGRWWHSRARRYGP